MVFTIIPVSAFSQISTWRTTLVGVLCFAKVILQSVEKLR
jgi:hypothetical protein